MVDSTKPRSNAHKYPVEDMLRMYVDEKKTPEEIALTLDLPLRGVITKLSAMKVYVKKGYVSKTGMPIVKKQQLVDQIAPLLGVPVDQLDSLEKVNKSVLMVLIKKLTPIG